MNVLLLSVLFVTLHQSHCYYFSDSISDLDGSESTASESIVFPRAIGPQRPVELERLSESEIKDKLESESNSDSSTVSTVEVEGEPSTTLSTTSTVSNDGEGSTEALAATTQPSAITTPPEPVSTTESLYFGSRSQPGLNQQWHYNDHGVNTNTVWFSNRDSVPQESQKQPVFVPREEVSVPVFQRKPVFTPEPAESNVVYKKAQSGFIVGEYPGARSSERNLYFPDISRINTATASNSVSSASSSASSSSASASSSSTSSLSSTYKANNEQLFGTKGGSSYRSSWQTFQSPVKAVRKVIKTGKSLTEKSQIETQSQPVRVRVVVQPAKTVTTGSNYFERLQDSKSTFYNKNINHFASSKAYSDKKEFIEVAKVTDHGTKTVVSSAIKSPPPPPRPAPIKTFPTKSAVRAPVFEQSQHIEENPEPEPYSFNFNVADGSGNGQFRREEGDINGVVRGSYGYTDAWGLYRIVDYVADANGFRASIRTNEPGLVERNPVTNEVESAAHIKVAAEETPAKVLDLMRLTKPKVTLI